MLGDSFMIFSNLDRYLFYVDIISYVKGINIITVSSYHGHRLTISSFLLSAGYLVCYSAANKSVRGDGV